MRQAWMVGTAATVVLMFAGGDLLAQPQRRQPPPKNAPRVVPRLFTPAVAVALGRQLSNAQTYSLDAGARRGPTNRSAIEFQRWAAIFQRIRATNPRQFPAAREKAFRELMQRVRQGQAVEPWKTVARILPRVLKQRPARPAPPSPKPPRGGPPPASTAGPIATPPGVRAQPKSPRTSLVGRWVSGDPALFSIYDPRRNRWRNTSLSGVALVLYEDGRYQRVIRTVSNGRSGTYRAVYDRGRYDVGPNQLRLRPAHATGYAQRGTVRRVLSPSTAPVVYPFAIRHAIAGSLMRLGRRLELRRISRRP